MNIALVLAGGKGTRLGEGVPKQYREVEGKAIIQYTLEIVSKTSQIDELWIVADESWHEYVLNGMGTDVKCLFGGFSKPGKTRQLSILNGLQDIRNGGKEVKYVMIHDAARPLVNIELIDECFKTIGGHQGVLPVLPMKDTVYFSENGETVSSLLKRHCIFAGQAPELFDFEAYYQANKSLNTEIMMNVNGSTEPAIMAGMDIVMIPGQEGNFKITTMVDLVRFREIIERRQEEI